MTEEQIERIHKAADEIFAVRKEMEGQLLLRAQLGELSERLHSIGRTQRELNSQPNILNTEAG